MGRKDGKREVFGEDEFGRSKTNSSSSASRKRFEEFRTSSTKRRDESGRYDSSRDRGDDQDRGIGEGRDSGHSSKKRFEDFRKNRQKNERSREEKAESDRGHRRERNHDRDQDFDDQEDDDGRLYDRRRENDRDFERHSRNHTHSRRYDDRREERGRGRERERNHSDRSGKRDGEREREDYSNDRLRKNREGDRRSHEHEYEHEGSHGRREGSRYGHEQGPEQNRRSRGRYFHNQDPRDNQYDDRYDYYARDDRDYHRDRDQYHGGPTESPTPTFERGDIVQGSVSRIEPYGAFVTIQSRKSDEDQEQWKNVHNGGGRALSALAHVSQISHLSRIDTPADVLTIGMKVYAIVLECYFEEYDNQYRNRDGSSRHREKISVSISGVDQETKERRDASQWTMPDPRPKRSNRDQDLGYGSVGGGGGEQMFANYMNGRGSGGGKNKQEYLLNRAKDRMENRRLQDGNNTWRGANIGKNQTIKHSHIPHIDLALVWGRSPSPPIAKRRSREREVESSAYRSRSSSSSSSSSSRSFSSSGSYSSHNRSSNDSDDSISRSRRNRRKHTQRTKSKRKYEKKRPSYSSSSASSFSNESDSDSSGADNVKERNTRKQRKRSSSHDDRSDARIGKRIKVSNSDRQKIQDGENENDHMSNIPSTTDNEEIREAMEFKKAVQGKRNSDSEDEDMGPMPLVNPDAMTTAGGGNSSKAYGGALLPGEGEALAAYVQQNLRIPRRGEIGYDANEIDKYEKSGFVMSGSRHARMNAVRIRKENQVYSAEEQRALALITLEENQQKEAALLNDFRTMLKEKQAKLTSQDHS